MFSLILLLISIVGLLAIFAHRYFLIKKSIIWQEKHSILSEQKLAKKALFFKKQITASQEESISEMKNDNIRTFKELFYKAEKSLKDGQFKEAEKYLINLLTMEEDNKDINHMLAKVYLETEQFSKAESIYEFLVSKHDNPIYYTNLGLCYYISGDLQKAVSAYEKALEMDPSKRERFLNLARVYEQMGNTQQAKEQYEKWVNKDFKDIDALLILAAYAENDKDQQKAYIYYRKVLDLSPYNEIAKAKVLELSFFAN